MWWWNRERKLVESFSDAAAQLGGSWAWDERRPRAAISCDAMIELVSVHASHAGRTIHFSADGVPPSIELTHHAPDSDRFDPTLERVRTHDEQFDTLFDVHGAAAHCLACLPADVRELLTAAFRVSSVVISAGRATIDIVDLPPTSALVVDWMRFTGKLVRRMQDSGRDPRASLERIIRDDELPPVRREAFRLLAGAFPRRADELAPDLLAHDDHALAALAARHLGASGLAKLRELLDACESADALCTAAEAVATLGDRDSAPRLVHLLAARPHPVRLAAVRSLGAIGGREQVEPLLALAGSLLLDRELGDAARDAVARIQSRLDTTARGHVSLAPAVSGGEISHPHAPAGALSVDDER